MPITEYVARNGTVWKAGQSAEEIAALETVCRTLHPQTIIELGTWYGGTTVVLREMCPSARIASFDIELPSFPHNKAMALGPNTRVITADVLNTTGHVERWLASPRPILLYCDAGGCNQPDGVDGKERSLQMYAPLIPLGSVIGCHDWIREVRPEVAEPIFDGPDWERYLSEETDVRGCSARFWRRVQVRAGPALYDDEHWRRVA